MTRLLPLLLPLLAWIGLSLSGLVPTYILPAPQTVAVTLVSEAGVLWPNLLVTLGETLAGLALGLVLGVGLAVAMTLSPRLGRLAGPGLVASQALPVFVLAPVLTLWMGYGPGPKVAMTVLLVFFPVASGLRDGLAATPSAVLDLARISGASPLRTLLWLRLPHALPHLGAALRIAVTYAPTGAVIGEWVGASKGLGYLMLMANARMKIDLMFAALVLIVAMTLLLTLTTDRVLKRLRM